MSKKSIKIPKEINDRARKIIIDFKKNKIKANKTYRYNYLTLRINIRWRILSKNNGISWEVMSHERYNNKISI
ncbi:hypothetical protein CBW53_02840 [Yersinia frederiksenii]|nr:hypothetical protein CBW53_02840 [Yersinia frederiksenii]CNI68286.1 Uncharacterised protein [Yersinia frederiksenii]